MTENIFDLTAASERLTKAPVHSRIMEWPRGESSAWVMAVFTDPGGAGALHRELKARIEATFLSELSRSPRNLNSGAARIDRVWVLVFPEIENLTEATKAFGLRPSAEIDDLPTITGHFRQEAMRVGAGELSEPAAVLEAVVEHLPQAEALETTLRTRLSDSVWGQSPGDFARGLLETKAFGSPPPDLSALRRIEDTLFPAASNAIRWVEPIIFQCVCDLVGMVADQRGYKTQWAMLDQDEDGNFPPPLLRVRAEGGWGHAPIGLELLRWSVMPIDAGEKIAAFTEWVDRKFPVWVE